MAIQTQYGPLIDLIRTRHSCRTYRPEMVPKPYIKKMIEAARLAPSSCNQQPWRFAVVTRHDQKKAIVSRGLLPGLATQWISQAPVLIVMGIHRSLITHRIAPLISGVNYAWIDLGIAGEHLVLQATELGLGTCWIGWIKPGVIRGIVGWPRDIRPAILFTTGWPGTDYPASETGRLPESDITVWVEEDPKPKPAVADVTLNDKGAVTQ